MTRVQFKPPAWAVVATAAALLAFGSLGVWQLHRGAAKQRLLDSLEEHRSPALTLSASSPAPAALEVQPAQARGRYVADRQLLEDGQARDGIPGFHVWTPLQVDGGIVLVDRGWVPRPAPALPAPSGDISVTGFWRRLPEPGLRLAGADACAPPKEFPAVVLYPTAPQLQCLLGQSVAPGILLLDPAAPGGFVREWSLVGFPPARHYGYAVQWFGLAALAAGLFVKLNLKRVP